MTTTTQAHTAATTPATNPHAVGHWVALVAIPIVFLGSLWGAGHNPAHAEWSAVALLAIIVIHLVKRVQRNAWNRRHGISR